MRHISFVLCSALLAHIADLRSRTCWTAAVARAAQQREFSFAYWEFGAGFGAYHREAGQWREPVESALLQPD